VLLQGRDWLLRQKAGSQCGMLLLLISRVTTFGQNME